MTPESRVLQRQDFGESFLWVSDVETLRLDVSPSGTRTIRARFLRPPPFQVGSWFEFGGSVFDVLMRTDSDVLAVDLGRRVGGAPFRTVVLPDLNGWTYCSGGRAGVVYALEYGTGSIKVGQTSNPQQRLRTHKSQADGMRVGLTRLWVSAAHTGYIDSERRLLESLPESGALMLGEYVNGITFDDVVSLARLIVEEAACT